MAVISHGPGGPHVVERVRRSVERTFAEGTATVRFVPWVAGSMSWSFDPDRPRGEGRGVLERRRNAMSKDDLERLDEQGMAAWNAQKAPEQSPITMKRWMPRRERKESIAISICCTM